MESNCKERIKQDKKVWNNAQTGKLVIWSYSHLAHACAWEGKDNRHTLHRSIYDILID
jgi:hypothetical protein